MKKNFLGDIRPMTHLGGAAPKKPVLADIEPVEMETEEEIEIPRHRHTPPTPPPFNEETTTPGLSWGKIGAFIALGLVVVGGGLYALSFAFRGATVTVTPKQVSGTVDLALVAGKDDSSAIHYEVMTLPETVSKDITATHTDTAKMKASGSVVLYNFQTTSQQLVATTRFADPNGQVFRLPASVTIPKKTVSGGKSTPGQLTVTLVADVGGTDGNIPLSDFTVVAFKGTAKEKLVYGKGKTAFSGGTSGAVFFLTDAEHKEASDALASELNAKLRDEALKQVPDGYVLIPESLSFTPDTEANTKNDPSQTATVTVTYGGKERGILIKKDELEKAFLDSIAAGETVAPNQVTFRNADKLTYEITTDISKETLPKTISFKVKGDLTAVWNIDQAAVKQLLVGAKRNVFASRMQTVTSVAGAELVIHPFWMSTLPTDAAKIKIAIKETTAK